MNKIKNKNLAAEIINMARIDQKARKRAIKDPYQWKLVKKIDELNLRKIKNIVKKFGLPDLSLVGKRALEAAWLLVQHADKDIKFQKYYLNLMEKSSRVNKVSLTNIAYLTDRVLVNEGRPQIYGTQFHKNQSGQLIPQKIKNEKRLDELRKKMNLESFDIYKKKIGAIS